MTQAEKRFWDRIHQNIENHERKRRGINGEDHPSDKTLSRDLALEQAEADILFVLKHPMQSCKVCRYANADCTKEGTDCHPEWRGLGEEKQEP